MDLHQPMAIGFSEADASDIVHELYQILLGREPDVDGLASNIERLRSAKIEMLSVIRGIAFSPEAVERQTIAEPAKINNLRTDLDSIDAERLVILLYQAFLFRDPKGIEVNQRVAELLSGTISLSDLIFDLSCSEERSSTAMLPPRATESIDPFSVRCVALCNYFNQSALTYEESESLEVKEGEDPVDALDIIKVLLCRPENLNRLIGTTSNTDWIVKVFTQLLESSEHFKRVVRETIFDAEVRACCNSANEGRTQSLMSHSAREALVVLLKNR